MSGFSFRTLNPNKPGPFAQYLLPAVSQLVGQSPEAVTCLGAVWDQSACGAAAVHWTGDCAVLVSLFVDPLARRQGVAGALLDLIQEECVRRGVEDLAAPYILHGDALAAMDALFTRRGAKLDTQAHIYEMDISHYHQVRLIAPSFRPSFRPNPHVQPFSTLSQKQLDALEANPDIPDVLRLSACRERLDPGLSLAWVKEDQVLAYLLGGQSGLATCSLLAAWRGEGAPGSSFLHLLQAQLNLCYYRCGGDFYYFLSAATPNAIALTERLTGGDYTLHHSRFAWLTVCAPDPSEGDGDGSAP